MTPRKPAVNFILVTLLLDVLGFGLIIPVMPGLVASFGGGDVGESSGNFGWFIAVYGLMQFLFSPMLGALSDKYGRRPIILFSLFGAGLDYVLMAFAPSLEWLFVGRIISGITGANFSAVNAYVADVTPPEKRAASYGMIGAAFGIGFVVGPALGGVLGSLGPRVPFMAAAVMNLCNAAYGYFVLPESLTAENRKEFTGKAAVPWSSVGALRRYPVVLGITFSLILVGFAQQGLQSTWVLYTTYRFNWTPLDNGLSLAVLGVCAAIVQGGLTRVIVPKIGERKGLLLGMSINVVAFACYGLSTQGWMLLVVLVMGAMGGIAGPSAQALISRQVSPSEQGTVQGAIASLQSMTGVVAPVVFTQLFGHFTGGRGPIELPGVGFLFGACCIAVATVAALRSFRRLPEPAASVSGVAAPVAVPH